LRRGDQTADLGEKKKRNLLGDLKDWTFVKGRSSEERDARKGKKKGSP